MPSGALKCQRVHVASHVRHSGDPTNISTSHSLARPILSALASSSAALEKLRKHGRLLHNSPWPTHSVVSMPMTTEHGVFCI